jgi:biopolymer transport protein ExbD
MAKIELRKRHVEGGDMDITPMIDCTFLLLIFFLLTSSSSSKSAVPLPKAHHGAEAAEADAIIITVARTPDGEPRVFLADDTKPNHEAVGSPEDQEGAIKKYLAVENAKVNKAGKQRNNVLIKAAVGLKHRDVDRVEKAVAKSDMEVQYLYLGISDKK